MLDKGFGGLPGQAEVFDQEFTGVREIVLLDEIIDAAAGRCCAEASGLSHDPTGQGKSRNERFEEWGADCSLLEGTSNHVPQLTQLDITLTVSPYESLEALSRRRSGNPRKDFLRLIAKSPGRAIFSYVRPGRS